MIAGAINRRYRVYLGLIALLAAVNVGHWLVYAGKGQPQARERLLRAEDFRLRVDVPGVGGQARDLFAAGAGLSHGGSTDGQPARKARYGRKPEVKNAPLPASAPDPARTAAEAGLGKLRLLGVVFHGGRREAYLAQDKENCIAAAGDTVFGQYAVDEITVDAVALRDTRTNMTRRIPVSGR